MSNSYEQKRQSLTLMSLWVTRRGSCRWCQCGWPGPGLAQWKGMLWLSQTGVQFRCDKSQCKSCEIIHPLQWGLIIWLSLGESVICVKGKIFPCFVFWECSCSQQIIHQRSDFISYQFIPLFQKWKFSEVCIFFYIIIQSSPPGWDRCTGILNMATTIRPSKGGVLHWM